MGSVRRKHSLHWAIALLRKFSRWGKQHKQSATKGCNLSDGDQPNFEAPRLRARKGSKQDGQRTARGELEMRLSLWWSGGGMCELWLRATGGRSQWGGGKSKFFLNGALEFNTICVYFFCIPLRARCCYDVTLQKKLWHEVITPTHTHRSTCQQTIVACWWKKKEEEEVPTRATQQRCQ